MTLFLRWKVLPISSYEYPFLRNTSISRLSASESRDPFILFSFVYFTLRRSNIKDKLPNNHIIANNYTRQGNLGSPMAVLNGANGRTLVRQHRQCIFDFQGK